ncbi:YeeE/YedE family protein [Nannocystis bainbridge]|uniref:YeeE/YedE thiosulfate transporter family protein n=1 Tax=Nannocystis bainbridge TaxID=2995303 RepID=A0ABT5EAF7_9BACT|nr:YeeE/YedE thiosulfate transporter family protein [Nannocystis bainbridge]MDC0722843.1 YeeE/YedE thiosulfate transporter family protein [Nannocystis bainbridge]
MASSPLLLALLGGLMIGAAAVLLLAGAGRIAGVSGIVGGALRPRAGDLAWRLAFVLGLLAGGAVLRVLSSETLPKDLPGSGLTIALAGLLVGFGARLGGGCTSGHGVCGLGRRSPRSLAAVLTFMTVAFVTVFLTRHVLGGAS